MREIGYRAYLKNKKQIVDVLDISFLQETIGYMNKADTKYTCANFNDIELLPYTGLKDKNGKKIFEGDIVEVEFLNSSPTRLSVVAKNEKFIYKIIFKNGCFGLQSKIDRFTSFDGVCNTEIEIIGNLYDNPELLKGESV